MNKDGKHTGRYGTREKKTKKFFGRISFRTFALSLVALIQISLLLIGATYSWVETISSIKFDGATGKVATAVKKIVNLSTTDSEVYLDDYFEQVGGNTHLAACSSADGESFFFPIVGENNSHYRKGTINDKNVNYVDFDFQIKNSTDSEKSFRFNEVPDVPNNVRIAIWADGYTPKVFAKEASKETDKVVCSTSGETVTPTVYPFSKYTADNATNDSAIFKIGNNCTATIYVKLWLQQSSTSTTESSGSTTESSGDIDIKNFRLVSGAAQKTVTVDYCKDSDDTMGTISLNNTSEKTVMVEKGQTVTLNQTTKTGYKFMGWYTDREGTKQAQLGTNNTFVVGDQSATFFAKFKKICKVTVVAVDCAEENCKANNKKAGAVRIGKTTSDDYVESMDSSEFAAGETVTIRAKAIDEGHEFIGWYTKKDFALENLKGSEKDLPVKLPEDVDSVTYYAQFKPKKVTISASAYKNSDGSFTGKVQNGSNTDTTVDVVTNYDGSEVTFTPVESEEGYVFDGWYNNAECTQQLVSDDYFTYTFVKDNNQCKVAINKKYQDKVTVYAKFRLKKYTVNIYAKSFHVVGENKKEITDSKYGTVTYTYNGSLAPASALSHKNIAVEFGKNITLQAKDENNYCTFDGWYMMDSDGSYTKVGEDPDYSPTLKGDDNAVYNFYAEFTIKTKEVAVAVPSAYQGYGTAHIGDDTTVTSKEFKYGDEITLKAVPTSNAYNKYKFSGWYDNDQCAGNAITDSDGNVIGINYDITVDGNTLSTYYAKFEVQKKTIRLHPNPPEGCNSVDIIVNKASVGVTDALNEKDKTYNAEYGTSMTFTVSLGDYYKVEAWYKKNSDGKLQQISNTEGQNSINGIIAQESESDYFEVKLIKKVKNVALVNKPDGECGDSNSTIMIGDVNKGTSGDFEYGTVLNITANPDKNHTFVGWYTDEKCETSVKDSQGGNVGSSFTVTVDDNTSDKYYAKYEYKTKDITVLLGTGVDGGSVNINDDTSKTSINANYGSTVNLVATPKDATYEFVGWYKDANCSGNAESTDATYSITVDENTYENYYAKFEQKKTITVHIKNYPSNWSYVYGYMWNDNGDNTWPGKKMTKNVATNEYELEINLSDGYKYIIFNKGSNDDNSQTQNLTIPSVGSKEICYDYESKKWTVHGETPTTTTTTPTVSEKVIYLENTKEWQTPYCYAWNDVNSNKNANWPGVKMTDTGKTRYGHSIYKIVISGDYTRLIFSDGTNQNQTEAIKGFENNSKYWISGNSSPFTVGQWTD